MKVGRRKPKPWPRAFSDSDGVGFAITRADGRVERVYLLRREQDVARAARGALPSIEGLDAGVARYVGVLREHGVETFESCEGGAGHAAAEPVVMFFGDRSEGFYALDVALKHGLPVLDLRRYWQVVDGEPCGPYWELTFRA